ncbi:AraC-like DNA-binding protein [Sphaerotilus hippei]|uniref:AraC-like DNA-binding protein n=1 Tax=Sphaerotilus hippei TaxID=744406 RepID=A0A318GYD4_9BURK|nr:helix-turn-helix transcriptional regulator [Sphaerotilus hippei]PXW94974.1 AraC-like DNA-binding protein [Sphaerotilus hippei]
MSVENQPIRRPRGRTAAGEPTYVQPLDPLRFAPTSARPVRAKARRLAADTRVDPHAHAWAQLSYSAAGVTRVTAGTSTYIVPPSRAVWIPAGVEHAVTVVQAADLRTLYFHQAPEPVEARAGGPGPWDRCRVVEVSSLLRELVQQLVVLETDAPGLEGGPPAPSGPARTAREHCLATLAVDELRQARCLPLGVALPQDRRLRGLCEAVLDDPVRHATLEGWAAEAGASARTIARLFRHELGASFVQWRQQVLLARALSLAARGRPMSHIAAELGYASPSAFSAMVTRTVGMSPSRFFGLERLG